MTVETKKVMLGTTGAEILSYNATRKYALIVNDSANEVYLAVGTGGIQMANLLFSKGSVATLEFNAPFSDGLFVVTTGNAKATFIYE